MYYAFMGVLDTHPPLGSYPHAYVQYGGTSIKGHSESRTLYIRRYYLPTKDTFKDNISKIDISKVLINFSPLKSG